MGPEMGAATAPGFLGDADGDQQGLPQCGAGAGQAALSAEGGAANAIGANSHAEGIDTVAEGEASHAEGYQTDARGYYSHSEGKETHAIKMSHSEGSYTYANNISHAEGESTVAMSGSHAEGSGKMMFYFLTGEANATVYQIDSTDGLYVGMPFVLPYSG